MEWNEFELHSARRQIKKIINHILDARKALFLAKKPSKLAGAHNDTTKAIEQNIDALIEGTIETQKLCAIAAESFKRGMKNPDAILAPEYGDAAPRLTPFQRALQKEGVVFGRETFTPKQQSKNPPRILPFRLTTTKRKNRRKSPDNPPL
jgi:hypothetical protein